MAISVEEIERALGEAHGAGDQQAVQRLERMRRDVISQTEPTNGPALSGALPDQQDGALESLRNAPVPVRMPERESPPLAALEQRHDRGEGVPMGVLAQERAGVMQPDPDTLTALEVGAKRIAANYFQRKDDQIATRDALYDMIYERLPEAEQERLKTPRHFGWQYDSYKNMPPMDFVAAVEKGGQMSQDDIKEMLGEDVYDKFIMDDFGSGSVYRHIVQPFLTKDGFKPGQQMEAVLEEARAKYTDATRESVDKPFVAEEAELLKPTTWFDDTTKAPWEDWDGFYYSFIEQAPNFAVAIAGGRQGGRLGAKIGSRVNRRLNSKVDELVGGQRAGAIVGGAAGGGASEGLLIRDAVYTQTKDEIERIPEDKWLSNPQFASLLEAGYDTETAKQVVSSEIANKAGNTAMVVSGVMLGSPMGAFYGRMAAGRVGKQAALPAIGKGIAGESLQEGVQETTEQMIGNLGVMQIDPEKNLFEGAGEAFAGGALTGGPAGAFGALPAAGGGTAGIDRRDKKVITATRNFTEAANERWKFQNSISRDDPAYEVSPQQRVSDLQKLERLQRKEADALLKAEPIMREYMTRNGAPDAEIKMLDRLKMRSNAMLTDIEVARSKRTTVAQMLEEERQIQKEREEVANRVQADQLSHDTVKSMADAIESAQNLGAVTEEDRESLKKAGYAKITPEGSFVILPKGRRALKELRRQQENLEKKMAAGYTGEERRDPRRSSLRDRIERAEPEELRHLLYTDHLTGLRNKRAFEDRKIEGGSYAAVDADSLKWVNDNMGHTAGDRMLQTIGRLLEKQDNVSAYHLSGDEFAVVGDTDADVEAALQAVAAELKNLPITEGTDQVAPAITWGKGKTYKEADAEANRMKDVRQQEGKRAGREQKPPSHRDIEQRQGLLFHLDEDRTSHDHDRWSAKQALEQKKPIAAGLKEWADLKLSELRKRATDKYRQLMKEAAPMTPDKRLVRLNMVGLKKIRSHSADRKVLDIIPQLRALLNTAVHLDSFPHAAASSEDSVRAHHWYGNRVELGDGKEYFVKLVVRESTSGSFHYDHDLTSVEEITDGNVAEGVSPADAKTLRQWWNSVKEPPKQEVELASKWRDVRDIVQPGDEVEILTQNGAVQGIVTMSRLRRGNGKDRLQVWADGREFIFNPERNWLIRPDNEDDLTWLNGGVEYQSVGESPPHVIADIIIGHLGADGYVYADLAAEASDPGYFETSMSPMSGSDAWYDYKGWGKGTPWVSYVYKPPEATVEEMQRAEAVVRNLTTDFRNLPEITLVSSLEELKRVSPSAYETMVTQAGSKTLGGIRGFWDDVNPENGIIIMVHNIKTYSGLFEKNLAETVLHELIGHYGVRGVFGNESELRGYMHQVVDTFPELARRKAGMLGLSGAFDSVDSKGNKIPLDPLKKQTLGEEMVAYVAGEMLSKGGIDLKPKQRSLMQKFFDWVRDWLVRNGWGKYLGIKPVSKSGEQVLWEDADTQRLLQRSLDFVRNGKGFDFQYLTGQRVRFMRDADIFRSGLQLAVANGMRKLSKGDRKSLAQKYGGVQNVPKELPLFPEEGSVNAYLTAISQAKAQGLVSAKEMELSKIEQFLKEATYEKLALLAMPGTDKIAGWMPAQLAREYQQLEEKTDFLLRKNMRLPQGAPKNMLEQFKTKYDDSINRAQARLREIIEMKLDPKKSRLDKDILLRYLDSDAEVRVRARSVQQSQPEYYTVAQQLGLIAEGQNADSLSDEDSELIRKEMALIQERGWNIGYDERTQRWLNWPERVRNDGYMQYTPQGVDTRKGYMVFQLVQEGGGLRTGASSHHNDTQGVFAHIRTGIGEFIEESSVTPDIPVARNPERAGELLMLAELQSDWLQRLRKGFSTQEAYDAARGTIQNYHKQLVAMAQDLGSRINADLYSDVILQLEHLQVLNQGSIADEYWEYAKAQTEAGINNPIAHAREFRNMKVEALIEQHQKTADAIAEWMKNNAPAPANPPHVADQLFTMDARAFDFLDKRSVKSLASWWHHDERRLTEQLRNAIDAETDSEFAEQVEFIRGRGGVSALQSYLIGNSDPEVSTRRWAAAKPLIDDLIKTAYTAAGKPVPDHTEKAFGARVERIVSIPVEAIQTEEMQALFGAPIGNGPAGINSSLGAWLNPAAFQRLGLPTAQFGFAIETQHKSIDLHVTGPEETVDLVMPSISRLLRSFFSDKVASSWETAQERAKRARELRSDPSNGLDFTSIADAFDMEEFDTDERGTELDDHGVYSYEEWEEREFDRFLDEEYDRYVENIDWDTTEADNGEPLNRHNSEYRALLEVDDDGDVDNSEAEDWLNRERDDYLDRYREDLREDPTYIHERMREDWDEAGGTTLWIGRLPVAWSEDGDVDNDVPIVFYRTDIDEPYRIDIDGNMEWESRDGDDRDEIVRIVREYYEENSLPLPSEPFGHAPMSDQSQLVLEAQEGPKDFAGLADSVLSSLVVEQKPAPPAERMYEDFVRLQKKLNQGGVVPDSPLAPDKYWRTTALKFLIAEAVRQGLPGVGWNPGLASTARGGMGIDAQTTNTLEWSMETMTIRGKEQELAVINIVDSGHKIVVDLKKHGIPILGRDVTEYIEQQRAGKKPRFAKAKGKKEEGPSRDDYLISRAGEHWVVQRRDNHSLLGIYSSEALRDEAIEQALEMRGAKKKGKSDESMPEHLVSDSGRITANDMGGPLAVITGDFIGNGFVDTFGVPRLAGARQSYEGITLDVWNDFLKQYDVQIGEHVVKVKAPQKAQREQGARLVPTGERAKRIKEAWGEVAVKELTGANHGWIVMSEKEGSLIEMVFNAREEAESWLESKIEAVFGTEDGGAKIFYFPITDKMAEDFQGPVPPFHYDPSNDPVLSKAMKRIGQQNQPNFRQRYREWKRSWRDHWYQGQFDRFYGLKRAVRMSGQVLPAETDPYIQARLTTSLDSVMRAVMEYGHPVWKDGIVQVEGKGLLEILQPVIKDIDTWCLYMAGVRAKRLLTGGDDKVWAEIMDPMTGAERREAIIKEGRERTFTPEMIDRMVKLGDQMPVLKRVAAEYAAYNKKVLDFAEEAGVINKDTRATWEHADYVPFYRVQDDRVIGGFAGSAGIANQNSPIRRLSGTDANVGDIAHNIMINLTKLVDSSMKNHASLLAIDALKDSGIITKEPYKFSSELVPMEQVKKLLIDKGMDPDSIPEDALEGFQKMFALQPPTGEGVLSVLRNGKKEFHRTDDVLLYRSMTAINKKQFGAWMNLMRAPKRLLTSWITIDPGFMIANYMRDSLSAFVLGRDNFVPVVHALKGFGKALAKDKDMRLLLSSGSAFESGYINQGDPNTTRRYLKKKMKAKSFQRTILDTPVKLYDAWRAVGSATENANRMAVYQAALRAGKSKAQAVYEAKDLMDFSMGGDWPFIQFLIQTVPFLGARQQGLHRLGRGAHEHPVAFTLKGTLVGLAGLALWFAFRDDERYKELEEWDKDTYFHWWIGDSHYRLPKPFEVGAIFNTIPERIAEYIYSQENDKGKHLFQRFGFMLAETFNANPVPQVAKPMLESYFNYNWFTGRDIVSPYEEQRMPPEQYRYTTSPTMVEIARALPGEMDTASKKIRSPLHLQNLWMGYTGTIGRYMLMGADAMMRQYMDWADPPAKTIADYPVVGRFVRGDAPRRTKYEQEVYDLIRKTTDVQGSVNFLAKTDQLERMDEIIAREEPYILIAGPLEDVREQVSAINSAIMRVWTDRVMTPEQKRQEIDILQEDKNALFELGYKMRPGGELSPQRPVGQADIDDLINKFGIDDIAAERLHDANPNTYDLLQNIADMNRRQLETLAKLK